MFESESFISGQADDFRKFLSPQIQPESRGEDTGMGFVQNMSITELLSSLNIVKSFRKQCFPGLEEVLQCTARAEHDMFGPPRTNRLTHKNAHSFSTFSSVCEILIHNE